MLTMSMIKTRMIIIISKNKNVEDEYDEDKDDGNADKDRNDGNEANAGPSSASLDGREHRTRTLSPSAVRPSVRLDPSASHRRNLVSGIKEVN